MTDLLDTNVCIDFLTGRRPSMREFLAAFRSLSFDDASAEAYGPLRAEL